MEAKHAPTPWTRNEYGEVVDANGKRISVTYNFAHAVNLNFIKAEENENFICRAYNAHEGLVDFLRDIDLLDHPDAGDYNPLCQGGTTNATALDNIMARARKLLSYMNAAGAA